MDRQEALERSQTGEKPEGGYYSASERISLRKFGLGRISRISSSRFTGNRGGAGGGRGGAIVPLSRSIGSSELVPTTQTPQVDSNLVSSLQKQINALTARDEQQLALNNNLISTLQNQFQIFQARIVDLGNQFLGVRNALILDANLEKKKELEEQNQEKKETEQQYRTDRENIIEKKIVSALMAPIKAIGERVQLTLARVMQFFGVLFAGWLFDKAIETFRALSEGNSQKLEDIKNSVLKNLGIVAGILFLLNGGFLGIVKIISSLSLRIGGFILKNTVGKFFSLLANAAKGLLGLGKKAAAPIVAAGAGAAGAGAAGGAADNVAAKTGAKAAGKGMAGVFGNIGKRLIPGVGAAFAAGATAIDISRGDYLGAALSAGSGLPGPPGWAFLAGRVGYGLLTGEDNKSQANPQTPAVGTPQRRPTTSASPQAPKVTPVTPTLPQEIQPSATSSISTQVTPQTPTIPSVNEYQINTNTSNVTEMSYSGNIDFSQPAMYGETEVSASPEPSLQNGETQGVSSIPQISGVPAAQTQRVPSATPTIGPEPEAKPNIVYMSSGGGKPQMPQMSERSGAASEVPFISSGNPDNFYLLYSQVSYNVVT